MMIGGIELRYWLWPLLFFVLAIVIRVLTRRRRVEGRDDR